MLKDHVDFERLTAAIRAYVTGDGPQPADVATWRATRPGERCDGCGGVLLPGSLHQEAFADGSFGHASCHVGGKGLTVTRRRRPRRPVGAIGGGHV
jgi:hypothetical protein